MMPNKKIFIFDSEARKRFLFSPVDIAPLALFRIFFGILLAWHCFEAIFSGWVSMNLIKPRFTFSHIGIDWLQPLPGNGMYYYFGLMGIAAIFVATGLFYRWSLGLFTILWAGFYFMQKTMYNNHYYLLMLIGIIMFLLPANRNYSLDAKIFPKIKTNYIPAWCINVMIFQIAIVYFFAAVAKLYPGWLDGSYIQIMLHKQTLPFWPGFYQQRWLHYFLAYSGFLFDLLIVPLLLWNRTRMYAFVAAILFHTFNSIHLNIGIFPFFALSFSVFFFPASTIRKIFFRSVIPQKEALIVYGQHTLKWFFIPYFVIQLALPVRHFFIKGDVLWTEEGHRLSWRMMLRSRTGTIKFIIRDNETGKKKVYKLSKILTKRQIKSMKSRPDMIWQTAQKIKQKYARKGKNISIFIDCKVSLNHQPKKILIDPNVDFAKAEWNYFFHNDWILLYD